MAKPLALCLLFLAVTFASPPARAQDDADLQSLSLEELLEVEVVTASRYAQRLKDSPMSVTVLTADQIRESGARDIPEALRLVQGMEVVSATRSSADVSARGSNQLASNAVLVLVDGRSVYQDFYGVTFWNMLPIGLADVQSIEIVRGPVSSLYGANAFAGVINIRTVAAGGRPGSEVWASTGTETHSATGQFAHSGRWGAFDTRTSLGFSRHEGTIDRSGPGSEMARLYSKAERVDHEGRRLELAAGFSNGYNESIVTPVEDGGNVEALQLFGLADWSGHDWAIRGYWNHAEVDLIDDLESGSLFSGGWKEDIFDMDLQKSRKLGERHRLLLGLNARLQSLESSLGKDVKNLLLAGYANDEWQITSHLLGSLGLRFDHHPLTGLQYSPRGSLLLRIGENHQLRGMAGSSFRNPSYLEAYWDLAYEVIPGFPLRVTGSEDLDAETIESYELSLQSLWGSRLLTSVSVYVNRMRGIITQVNGEYYPSPPAPIPGIIRRVDTVNEDDIDVLGLEWSTEIWWTDWMQWTLNGSVVEATDPADSGQQLPEVPRYRANLGLRIQPNETWKGNFWVRYVSESTWKIYRGLSVLRPTVGDHVIVDARLAHDLFASTEVAIAARNLLDHPYREYGVGHEFGRELMLSVQTRF